MNDDAAVEMNLKGLEKLLTVIKSAATASAKVGVLGKGGKRSAVAGETSTPTNAEIGAIHEYGTATAPERSWLRMPLTEKLPGALESSGEPTEATLQKCMNANSAKPYLEIVGIAAVGVINEAFDTGGFGQWPPHAAGYENNTGNILVDTAQLRNAVSYEVKAS